MSGVSSSGHRCRQRRVWRIDPKTNRIAVTVAGRDHSVGVAASDRGVWVGA